jgi:hypothetical protein
MPKLGWPSRPWPFQSTVLLWVLASSIPRLLQLGVIFLFVLLFLPLRKKFEDLICRNDGPREPDSKTDAKCYVSVCGAGPARAITNSIVAAPIAVTRPTVGDAVVVLPAVKRKGRDPSWGQWWIVG